MIWIPPHNRPDGISTIKTPGFVYFIRAKTTGLIKIGWATKPEARRAMMQAMSPDILEVVAFLPGDGRDEKAFHTRFGAHRKHGEWFAPAKELLSLIAEIGLPDPPPAPKPQYGPPFNPHDDLRMRHMRIAAQALEF